jgi:dipeptidyl aminopeptidase/acylaminoacyl peptidase
MVMQAAKFTPEVLLSAPRRSAALPNKSGEQALYTVSTYSFEEHKKRSEIKLLDIASGQSTTLYEDLAYSEPVWIGKDDFVFIKDLGKGKSSLLFADASSPGSEPQEVEAFEGTIANVKVKESGDGTYAFACSALATPDGKLHNPEAEEKPHSSARLYDSLFVRHWDAYRSKNRDAIWYGSLKRSKDGKLELQKPGLINALKGTGLESPVPTFGGAGDFDISSSGLVFVAKDPVLNEALYTKSDAYYVPLKSFTDENPPAPQVILTGRLVGYANSPAFSPDGLQVAFTRMRDNRYESDKTRIMLVPNIEDLKTVIEIHESEDGKGRWDYRPGDITWAPDAKELFVTAENRGKNQIWRVPLPASTTAKGALPLPTPLSGEGSVGEFRFLRHGDSSLLVSSTSLIDSSTYYVLDPGEQKVSLVSSGSKGGKTFGLSRQQVDDFNFDGGGDYKVHALVVRPSNFDSSKKYPLAMLIHGGPQGAWLDSWSTRWNPAVFAEQGYIVVTPNPTGSTGYGQKFQDDIAQNWGGNPYEDIVKCFDYVETNLPYVDIDRAVALGASYGGYMMSVPPVLSLGHVSGQ